MKNWKLIFGLVGILGLGLKLGYTFDNPFYNPNTGSGASSWSELSGIPAAFADGVDDVATPGSNPFTDDSAGTIYMTTNTNNVGIGTTAPNGYKLHVAGGIYTSSTFTAAGVIYANQGVVAGGSGNSYSTTGPLMQFGVGAGVPFSLNPSTAIFNTTILGIGLTNPTFPVQMVSDNATANMVLDNGASGTNPTVFRIRTNGTTRLTMGAAMGNNNYILGVTTGDAFALTPTTSTKLHLAAGQSIGTVSNLTIMTSGTSPRVGIATTNPGYTLDVNGAMNVTSIRFPDGTVQVTSATVGGVSDATKLPLAGGTMSGDINMDNHNVLNVATITSPGGGQVLFGGPLFSVSNPAKSSATFILSGGTLTLRGNGIETSATTLNIGDGTNTKQIALSATAITNNANSISTGTSKATAFIDSNDFKVGQATEPWNISLASSPTTGFNSMTFDLGAASLQYGITVRRIDAVSLPSGTTTLFQLDERTLAGVGSAGTNVFSVSYATATSPGVSYTSFSNATLAAGSSLVLTTPSSGAGAGNPSSVRITIWYTKD